MKEIVRNVKGYDITRTKGTRGVYEVVTQRVGKHGNIVKETYPFRSAKQAEKFINTNFLPK